MAKIEVMTVTIHTTNDVDPQEVADLLIEAGYLVDSVMVTDGFTNRSWQVKD